jgi:uncharacterized membrane protein YdjX (TVP38/TMEM64 family)
MEQQTTPVITPRQVGIRYGLILAGVSVVYFFIATLLGLNTTEGPGQWASLIFVVVLVVLAHQYYKEKGTGYMSYGEGMSIGFFATLISSTISSFVTYVYIKFIDATWIEQLKEMQLEQMEERGMSDEEIEMAMSMMDMFTTPGSIFVFGIIGGVIGGVIISLLVTIFTQKNNTNPFN